MAAGYVYILINASIPNQVKIGCSARSAEERAREISVGTGVPTPFVVAYAERVGSYQEAEREIHLRLANVRVNRNREFFTVPLEDAKKIVAAIAERYPAPTVDVGTVIGKPGAAYSSKPKTIDEWIAWAEQHNIDVPPSKPTRTRALTSWLTAAGRRLASCQSHAPAKGLITVGAANALLAILASVGALIQSVEGSNSQLFSGLGLCAFMGICGVIVLFGGVRMHCLRDYGFVRFACVVAILSIGVCWIFAFAVGLWALVVLRRDDVRKALLS